MSKREDDTPLQNTQSLPREPPPTPRDSNIKQFMRDWVANIKVPPFEKWRKPVKQALAMMIASIMTLSDNCRNSIGQGSLLCAIVIVFFFPARTFGVVFEDVIYGTLGALIASLYSLLGIFCANLARDPNIPYPVQPKSSGVLIVFLFIGVYIMTIIRFSVPRANFACIHAAIIFAFTLTDASLTPGFHPSLVWQFLIPVTVGAGISLAVSAIIWPDDSMTNYMNVVLKGLEGHNTFFKEHSEAFFTVSPASVATTLPSLHDRLQGCMLTLIDCKRAVHRDILYSRLNGSDISKLTKLIKELRPPLHGIGLSQIIKREILQDESAQEEQDALKGAIGELDKVFQPLTEACYNATKEAIERLRPFHGNRPRSILNSILWPFPRIFDVHHYIKKIMDASTNHDIIEEKRTTSRSLKELLIQLAAEADNTMWPLAVQHSLNHHERSLHLFGQYRYQLRNYTQRIVSLLEFVEEIERTRTRRRFWFPTIKALKKRFFSNKPNESEHHQPEDPLDLTLVRTNTRREALGDLENPTEQASYVLSSSGKLYYRDPDVDPPASRRERFWYAVHKIILLAVSANSMMGLKTAAGTVLMALPFYIANSAAWYMEWRGNWALIILQIWLSRASGMFIYATVMRLLGTVAGGVLGIVVWEIAQGNPYGLAVVLFIAYAILYYILMTNPNTRMFCILTVVTLTLVAIYTYNYKMGVFPGYSPVWTIAGKRILLVCIGVVAAAILSIIPRPIMARVELRKSLAHTVRDIGRLYGILTSQFLVPEIAMLNPTKEQKKGFRRLTLDLRRQIAEERTYMHLSSYEPPLRGRFPAERYRAVLETVDSMADLVAGMGYILEDIRPSWRQQMANTLQRERLDYIASIMTSMKLIATTLSAKMALPPYLIGPGDARDRFLQSLNHRLEFSSEDITHPSFLSYSAYIVTSSAFVKELQYLLETVEDLVGVEDPQEWLRKHM